jgi:hypothetical protein
LTITSGVALRAQPSFSALGDGRLELVVAHLRPAGDVERLGLRDERVVLGARAVLLARLRRVEEPALVAQPLVLRREVGRVDVVAGRERLA